VTVDEVWLLVAIGSEGEHLVGEPPLHQWKAAVARTEAQRADLEKLAWMMSDPAVGLEVEVRRFTPER
jgi:hypothetical protein